MARDQHGIEASARLADETETRRIILWTGIAGMMGAVAFIVGDVFHYFTLTGERDFVAIMSRRPLWTQYLGADLGILGSWLYTLGTWQIYLAARPAGRRLAVATFFAFAAVTIGMGAFQSAFTSFGLVGRTANLASADAAIAQAALGYTFGYIGAVKLLLYPPAIIFAILFVWLVITNRTRYPRWFFLCTPSFLFFVYPAISYWLSTLSSPSLTYMVIVGSFPNYGLLLFFAASTFLLLRDAPQPVPRKVSIGSQTA